MIEDENKFYFYFMFQEEDIETLDISETYESELSERNSPSNGMRSILHRVLQAINGSNTIKTCNDPVFLFILFNCLMSLLIIWYACYTIYIFCVKLFLYK